MHRITVTFDRGREKRFAVAAESRHAALEKILRHVRDIPEVDEDQIENVDWRMNAVSAKVIDRDERSAQSVMPKPSTVRDRHIVETVGKRMNIPADEVTISDMREFARDRLSLAVKEAEESNDANAKTDANHAHRVLRWLTRNA